MAIAIDVPEGVVARVSAGEFTGGAGHGQWRSGECDGCGEWRGLIVTLDRAGHYQLAGQ